MESKSSSDSRTIMTKLIRTIHTDSRGYVFGGQILSWIDIVASISARRHSNLSTVTRSVDAVHFLKPIKLGYIVVLKAAVNRAWITSMEIGVRVETENPLTGKIVFCCHAYLTFIAMSIIDGLNKPTKVIPFKPKSEEELMRYKASEERRKLRFITDKENLVLSNFRQQLTDHSRIEFKTPKNTGVTNFKDSKYSYSELIELILPQHANTLNITFGGQIMEWMDQCAVTSALRFSRSHLLTASVDSLQFHKPTYVGNIITIRGMVTRSFSSSMEVYVSVSSENVDTGEVTFSNDGFFTVVAVNEENTPIRVPEVITDVEEKKIMFDTALDRKLLRIEQIQFLKMAPFNDDNA